MHVKKCSSAGILIVMACKHRFRASVQSTGSLQSSQVTLTEIVRYHVDSISLTRLAFFKVGVMRATVISSGIRSNKHALMMFSLSTLGIGSRLHVFDGELLCSCAVSFRVTGKTLDSWQKIIICDIGR